VSLDYLPRGRFLPEALLNYLGTIGSVDRGRSREVHPAGNDRRFSFDRISLGGPVFDLVKLSAVNADYLRALDDDGIVARLRQWRLSDEFLKSWCTGAQAYPAAGRVRAHDEFFSRAMSTTRPG